VGSLAHRARLVGPGLRPDTGRGLRYDKPRMIDPWLLLKSISAGTAAKLAPNVLAWINRLSGLVLIGFAFYALSAVNLRALP